MALKLYRRLRTRPLYPTPTIANLEDKPNTFEVDTNVPQEAKMPSRSQRILFYIRIFFIAQFVITTATTGSPPSTNFFAFPSMPEDKEIAPRSLETELEDIWTNLFLFPSWPEDEEMAPRSLETEPEIVPRSLETELEKDRWPCAQQTSPGMCTLTLTLSQNESIMRADLYDHECFLRGTANDLSRKTWISIPYRGGDGVANTTLYVQPDWFNNMKPAYVSDRSEFMFGSGHWKPSQMVSGEKWDKKGSGLKGPWTSSRQFKCWSAAPGNLSSTGVPIGERDVGLALVVGLAVVVVSAWIF
ncbi:hypothetical protein B0H63DRAFT_485560 [Podospora didyma]|uniref:Uncharacterized protein n=1 Tax=Podospora didyma TaxID=330526 RepID=A0AAE0KB96_9PEZI|nr:hypothetical protein B0H63DRAFT_485560 [Podospora didyma]